MDIVKFDLYKREWLDLVFADKNKNYGAYDLRVHYGDNMLKALAATMVGITVAAVSLSIVFKHKTVDKDIQTVVTITPYISRPEIKKEKPKEAVINHEHPPKSIIKPATAQAAPNVAVKAFKVPLVTNDPVTNEPPTISELKDKVIGQVDNAGDGKATVQNTTTGTPGVTTTTTGTGTETADNTPYEINGVDVLPEPIGGSDAWSKFLQRNLRYPDTENQGRVLVSFVVEKDGHLTDINILKGVATELDAEALRVLKKAPAWKPGMQNGRPVRVKFTVPIVFQLNQ
ncbi:energy transducer TonB [Mucilaginibacter robiniae]|uniref:Energy transducer TonB n=1 Tax=Mucilaginibacter robiniae TaxID=2728022 RepID=A0A7L5E9T0_9SPHI|nr:energy transducer TonB [Mucilaginibacter robiniae]QJD97653.1 energy transducer TonB [Mucilaginibacter robiniae]